MSKNHTPQNRIPIILRKTRYRYVPVQEPLKDEDGNGYVSYGISIRSVEDELAFVSDISTDFDKVRQLADLCTEQELDPIHLNDVIEDFLVDEDAVLI